MWQPLLSSLVVAVVVKAFAIQAPLALSQHWKGCEPTIPTLVHEDLTQWKLTHYPNPNATDNLVFETVHALLQHWPNTRMRNGHNIVPGSIPKGTLLYHGRPDKVFPTYPEWLATDPEHSYLLCRDRRTHSPGWHLTLMATRPLKVIYFDGSSAVKFPFGSMDTQDLITGGKPTTGRDHNEERNRIQDLCDWGKNFGVDGFVRMEMDFEVMYCDFTSGLNVVSFERIASKPFGSSSFSILDLFESFNSGAWHNHFPGETRIQLDLPGMVSFYDTELVPSLIALRAGQERWDHRVLNVSNKDIATLKSRLEENLMRPDGSSSGIDWKTLIQVIVDRYAQRLELTRYLLNSTSTEPDDILDLTKKVQTQLRIMLTPYLLVSASPSDLSDGTELDWTLPIYKLCATTHTRSMESQFNSMTDSEKTLLRAVRGTSQEICRVVTRMWASGVYAGVDPSLNTKESLEIREIAELRDAWVEELDRLMAWLDWNVWVKCKPECGVEEMCYLPTWPVGFPWLVDQVPNPFPAPDEEESLITSLALRTTVMENLANEAANAVEHNPDDWIRPQPKCIRRFKPYTF